MYPNLKPKLSIRSLCQAGLFSCGVWLCLSSTSLVGQVAVAQQSAVGTATFPAGFANAELPTRPVLKSGSKGEAVVELQATLKLLGYYNGSVNGVYDANTMKAVRQFQKAAGIKADGIAGSTTWSRLFPASPNDTARGPAASVPAGGSADSFPTGDVEQPIPAPTAKPSTPSVTTPPAATPRKTTPASGDDLRLPVLKKGMRGPAVVNLQERLRSLGFYKGKIDGVYGTGTETAVKNAQRSFGIKADGVVGSATWSRLMR